MQKNRQAEGERSGTSKLSTSAVKSIIELYKTGNSVFNIAVSSKVSINTIYNIIYGKTWKSITGGANIARTNRIRISKSKYQVLVIPDVK